MKNKADQVVLILDFGSQYTQLIARRCREEGVFSRIERWDIPLEVIRKINPLGIILSGGPYSVYAEKAPFRWSDLTELGVPLLGICYGMQLMMEAEGGKVEAARSREYGLAHIERKGSSFLLRGLKEVEQVWMSHGDYVVQIPPEWKVTAVSEGGLIAAVEHKERPYFGVQFHPEVTHTPSGPQILRNFLYRICHAEGGWSMESFLHQATREIAQTIKKGNAICALSGGVDSSVAAAIVNIAVPGRLYCVFVDNGLLRKGEAEEVKEIFTPIFQDRLIIYDAREEFFRQLRGVVKPEEKRRLIGRKFIQVFKRVARSLPDVRYLVQGTLYPDVIESAVSRGPADVIKSHHNVGGLPKKIGLKLVEPLRELFKDEVRLLGSQLGLPSSVINRHPFPGPGLSVRIVGEVTPEAVKILQEADAIFIEELRKSGLYDQVSQAFAVLLPVRSVGVQGDSRTYERVIALRSVNTSDFMTARISPLPLDFLELVATRIANQVKGVNRVVYDITSKPPATVEWE